MKKTSFKKNPQESIYQASLELLSSKGYSQISMEDIADRAKMSKANLYYHFDSKQELFLKMVQYFKKSVMEKIRNIVKNSSSSRKALENIFMIGKNMFSLNETKSTLEFLVLGIRDRQIRSAINEYVQQFMEVIVQIIEHGRKNGEFKTKHDARELAAQLVHSIVGLKLVCLLTDDAKHLYALSNKTLHFLLDLLHKEEL